MKKSLQLNRTFRFLFLPFFLMVFSFSNANAQNSASLNFDGTNDNVILYPFLSTGASYTKEAWIKIPVVDPGTHNIISENNSALYIASNGFLSAGHNPGYSQVQDPDPLTPNVWYHVAVTYDQATGIMTLYKNGVPVSTNTAPAFTSASQTRLGSIYTGTDGYFFQGDMDEVRIWSVARSAAEIAADYRCEISSGTTGLLAYYNFEDGTPDGDNTSVTTLKDESGNNYDGTINNFAMTGTTSNFTSEFPVLTGPCSVLAVDMISFSARVNGTVVDLSWKTASEMNNAGFDVQRSATGNSDWTTIGFVKGNGTSGDVHEYTFQDMSPLGGKNFYRLNQKDLDGKSKISQVVGVVMNVSGRVSIYPTVTRSLITLSLPDNSLLNTEYVIFGNQGKVIKKELISSTRQSIDVSNLQKGIYYLKVQNGSAMKFIKQ